MTKTITDVYAAIRKAFPGRDNQGLRNRLRRIAQPPEWSPPYAPDAAGRLRASASYIAFTAQGRAALEDVAAAAEGLP